MLVQSSLPTQRFSSSIFKPLSTGMSYNKDEKVNILGHDFAKNDVRAYGMALTGVVVGAMLVSGRAMYLSRNLNRLRGMVSPLEEEAARLRTQVETLAPLKSFSDILDGSMSPNSIQNRVLRYVKARVSSGKLDYDALKPPIIGKKEVAFEDALELLPKVPTTNRSFITPLDIPAIRPDGSFDFHLPSSKEVKITHATTSNFAPRKNSLTNVSENYADSVYWDNDKIARDILQNFYDGHGQTLDGVRLSFTPAGSGKYRVRIEGESSYTADKAILIGESSKRDNAQAAGNYGEGLKMAVLKLLKSKGAEHVDIGSGNWLLSFKFLQDDISAKRVLAYDLDKTALSNEGNFLEFETTDRGLLESLRSGINKFYHSGNTDFKCPDFENSLFGIKLTASNSKNASPASRGSLYIAGQEIEVDGNYRGLQGMTLFLKQKPPKDVLDFSRDRTSLNASNLEEIMRWLYWKMSDEEKLKFISIMEPAWGKKNTGDLSHLDVLFRRFLRSIEYSSSDMHINFPKDKYVAFSNASDELVQDLVSKGYTICDEGMEHLGMQTIRDLMGEARAHNPIAPNAEEIKKINIIREALGNLSSTLKDKHFTQDELNTKIYLFDKNADKERRMNSDTLAEAIIDKGISKGFWVDKNYFDKANFGEILETALHELSHKAGGDESSVFSYKLTDVNSSVLKYLSSSPFGRKFFAILNKLWNEG